MRNLKSLFIIATALAVFTACLACAYPSFAAEGAPDSARAQMSDMDKAKELYKQGKYNEAIVLLKEYIKTHPDSKAYYLIAYSYYKLGKDEEGKKYFQEAFLIEPRFSPTPNIEKEQKAPLEIARPERKIKELKGEIPPAPRKKTVTIKAVRTEDGVKLIETDAAPSAEAVEAESMEHDQNLGDTVQARKFKDIEQKSNEPLPTAAPPELLGEGNEKPKESLLNAAASATDVKESAPPGQEAAPEEAEPAPRPIPTMPEKQPSTGELVAVLMAFLIPIVAVLGLVYALMSLVIFKIGKKMDVPMLWLSFVPIGQMIPFIMSAGKYGVQVILWFVLLLTPLGMFVMVYLWMCIAGNLGKNKLLGLLMLVPVANIAVPLWLAFSKAGGSAASSKAVSMPDLSGEPDIDLPDIGDDLGLDDDFAGGGDDALGGGGADEDFAGGGSEALGDGGDDFGGDFGDTDSFDEDSILDDSDEFK